jgi:cell fate regulator YaaT (PSP1 superfamily)
MRTDGLPNTLSIPELNAFRTRWKDVSDSAEPTMERVIERYPEAVRVVTDIDNLLIDLEEMSEEKLNMLIKVKLKSDNNSVKEFACHNFNYKFNDTVLTSIKISI